MSDELRLNVDYYNNWYRFIKKKGFKLVDKNQDQKIQLKFNNKTKTFLLTSIMKNYTKTIAIPENLFKSLIESPDYLSNSKNYGLNDRPFQSTDINLDNYPTIS